MEFEFRIPKDVRLRAHISQRNNLKYVKIVMDHFDEWQCQDFRNSTLGYLAEVPNIQFSAQLIQELVFRIVCTDKVNELWFNVQGHLMRFDLQEYALMTGLRCGVSPEGDDFDRLIQRTRLKESCMCTPHFVPPMQRLNNPTFPYVLYDDPLVPMVDDIARTTVAPQFNASYADSGNGRAPVTDLAMVRIPAEGRRVRIPRLERHELLFQCEGRRWGHEELEHQDPA
ncbi:Hypothetical predicted protein [Olea europaea subsp. europaea]|uniref:DUF1985 domain-containing protein n=1 Tax=Olea europaea subsp. europaea TaxID=158383 RepID=A0A8S0VIW2_OLEEU|nr:Hypothetical predicted protein [Olea europaea subsp. europaea]